MDPYGVHNDPEIYLNPTIYNPIRFSRPKEEADASAVHSKVNGTVKQGLTTTSEIFLPFSHGRHACSGRFFVSQEMKMLFAYMVMNYDIELLKSQPSKVWFGQASLGQFKAKVRVRRREGTLMK